MANVKWLTRIEVSDQRYAGRFMARDYVTIREEERDGETVWTFATVGHDRLKSAPAKVTRHGRRYTDRRRRLGRADRRGGGADRRRPVARGATARPPPQAQRRHATRRVRLEVLDASTGARPAPGEHTVTSRAFDLDGNVQPTPDDPSSPARCTYWESNGQITRRVLVT